MSDSSRNFPKGFVFHASLEITRENFSTGAQDWEGRDGIKGFSEKNPEKIEEAVAKLTEARKILYDAIGLLLDSGNTKKNLSDK